MNEKEAKQQAAALIQRIKKEPELMYNNVGWDVYMFLTNFAGKPGPISGKQLHLPFDDDCLVPEEQILRDFTLFAECCDDTVNVHTTKDGKTGVIITIYEVGDHYYTEAEFNALWPEFNKHVREPVHDKKIYEDTITWLHTDRGDAFTLLYPDKDYTKPGHLYFESEFNWRTDYSTTPSRQFVWESDLDIKWDVDEA
jgi:hypothetical protein